jgi:hypothetical protein
MGPTPQDFLVVLRYRAGADGRYPPPGGNTYNMEYNFRCSVGGHPRADWEWSTRSKDGAAVSDIAALLSGHLTQASACSRLRSAHRTAQTCTLGRSGVSLPRGSPSVPPMSPSGHPTRQAAAIRKQTKQ